ncbi:MAG: hypothetical protein IJY66_06085 [Clostridia bacterium]|nr:hypothetical protein [Clostridia bacterium]
MRFSFFVCREFERLFLSGGATQCVALCGCVTSLSFNKEVTKKVNSAVPSEASPEREKSRRFALLIFSRRVASSAFASAFSIKTPTRKKHASETAKVFAICDAPESNKISSKTILFSAPAAKTGCRGASPYRERKNFFFLRLPRVVTRRREMQQGKDVFLPGLPCSAARKRFPKAAAFGSLSWFVLSRMRKNEHLCCTDQRAPQVRSMIVRRKSCKKSWQFLLRKAVCVSKEEVAENSAKLPLPVARS